MTQTPATRYLWPFPLAELLCIGLSAALLLFAVSGQARAETPPSYLPILGGRGGAQFDLPCPSTRFGAQSLHGFQLRAGDDLDAIRAVCIILKPYHPATTTYYPEDNWVGGDGGARESGVLCPADAPVVLGMRVVSDGVHTMTVHNITLYCGTNVAHHGRPTNPFAVFNASLSYVKNFVQSEYCPDGQVATGVRGRSGVKIDAIGLICGEPYTGIATSGLKPLGRVKPGGGPSGPPLSICDVARKARARNSPAAPGLEAQCRNAGASGELLPPPPIDLVALHARGAAIANDDPEAGELRDQQREGPARRGFEIGLAAAGGDTAPGPGKQRIHDLLDPAEQGGYTTAVNFSLARNRKKLTDLAPRGEAIANADPLALELRDEQADRAARLGFDIGMAAAEGQTAPGPGKQKIHDSLGAAEQAGFTAAVTFSLDRNRNKDLPATGAAIAAQDRFVATARNAEPDAMHRLGFDIATGIFGDPALGALGNTAKGPGSLGIRNALSSAGQRGFDDSVAFHLSRKYKP